MKIMCQERYNEAVNHAQKTNDASLQCCLDRFKQWEEGGRCEVELHTDYDPLSFFFIQRYKDGRQGLVGGLIYHGSPDESFSVQLVPKIGWQIHT